MADDYDCLAGVLNKELKKLREKKKKSRQAKIRKKPKKG